MTTFNANACYYAKYLGVDAGYEHNMAMPTTFTASIRAKDYPGVDIAAVAAEFPKYVGVKVSPHSLWFEVHFNANGVNKGNNEAGIKRLRKFVEIAGPLNWNAPALNSYQTLDEFLAVI